MLEDPSYRVAVFADVPALTVLFDAYRQFYECPPDLDAARAWLQTNLAESRSVILVADAAGSGLLGFTQLYPALCSVDLVPYYVLYDLYVAEAARGRGIGRGLMQMAEQFARTAGMARLDLETANDNLTAQNLYSNLGYIRDDVFFKYSLDLKHRDRH